MDESEVRDRSENSTEEQLSWQSLEDVFRPPVRMLEDCLKGMSLEPPIHGERPPLVLIKREVLFALKEASRADVTREHGGVLLGMPYEDPGGRYFGSCQQE